VTYIHEVYYNALSKNMHVSHSKECFFSLWFEVTECLRVQRAGGRRVTQVWTGGGKALFSETSV